MLIVSSVIALCIVFTQGGEWLPKMWDFFVLWSLYFSEVWIVVFRSYQIVCISYGSMAVHGSMGIYLSNLSKTNFKPSLNCVLDKCNQFKAQLKIIISAADPYLIDAIKVHLKINIDCSQFNCMYYLGPTSVLMFILKLALV